MKKNDNNYFDIIDNSHKAYWLGFLWCDGYVWERKCDKGNEYGVKLDLSSEDFELLVQFKNDVGVHTDIKQYAPCKNSFGGNGICRCSYYNKHLVSILINKYGIIPHRINISKLLQNLPQEFEKDFIRGCLDADGSFTLYRCIDRTFYTTKAIVDFGGTKELLYFIWNHLLKQKVVSSEKCPKFSHRHKDRDGVYRNLKLSGKQQTRKILSYLYDDAEIYLPRKYNKYQSMKEELNA